MAHKIKYIKDKDGKRVGIFLSLKEWRALLAGDFTILNKYRRKKRVTKAVDLPVHNLGDIELPSREILYDEWLFNGEKQS